MREIIDARGLACPQPVILAKRALEMHKRIVVMVDNAVAMENVRRLGAKSGCEVTIDKKDDGTYHIHMSRTHTDGDTAMASADGITGDTSCHPGQRESFVVVVSDNRMGRGNDELGYILIRSFLHTLLQLTPLPDRIIFYNSGVHLTTRDSEVLEDLKQLADSGVEILVCGTCVNYFGISDKIGVGTISNMHDIVTSLSTASRLITP
ncbi:MAG: sulfurtransferase-like selenium metabolism protein YedF [Deltaproteobacteria bacterium]|nr:sulfurtransferase-like selenium metabolism protein YedF [Deltaproteobacteria bacterium]